MKKFIPFARPDIGNEEINEVISCMKNGWLTSGPQTKRLERDFVEFLGGHDLIALAVNSATAGLHLALEALGVGIGDEVITTTHTFTATAEVIRYVGATPVFVDIDPNTFCIDLKLVEASITKRTRAVIPVHFGGHAANIAGLVSLLKNTNIKIIEDAAHALPTTQNGKLVGTFDSDVTVFSFYANKTMTTGEGGMIVTKSPDLAKRMSIMRLHGIDRDVFDRFTSTKPSWHYDVVAPGFKYNLTDIAASIGIHQLKKVMTFHSRREEIAKRYSAELPESELILPSKIDSKDIHSWHLYVLQLKNIDLISRNRFIEEMFNEGVGCSVHYIPLHLQTFWRKTYKLTPDQFPVSQNLYERSVSLPIYSGMSDGEVGVVINSIKKILNKYDKANI